MRRQGQGGLWRLAGEGRKKEAGLTLTFPQVFDFAALLPSFKVHYAGEERGDDGLDGGCCVEGSLGSEGYHLQKEVYVVTGLFPAVTGEHFRVT